ncbi:MAG: hypothetical protein IMF26_00180 [Candidatus Fermentithermobacillus carboniphilus]|uniref:DUF6754 domain-containing protein n=1 Tax=Candidatus Fermentithermobacillus carboniphilus TaxID=3085328 RepID=A0AAT9LCU6_9FIRM|nr:MAG: hypothetical protein IMF26_00180 [Candidatus Fermentithermobacillus carboniphilus]
MNPGRISQLVFLVAFICILFIASESYKRTGKFRIRRIPGLDAIDELVGRATEMGRPLAFVFGAGEMEAQTFASLRILGYVCEQVARYDARLHTVTPLPEIYPMCLEIQRSAYVKQGKPQDFNQDFVQYLPADSSKASVLGLFQREKVSGVLLFGNYYYESMVFAEAASLVGAATIAGTANFHQLPFFVAACDYTLIGEELFAAGVYMSREPSEIGALTAQEAAKVAAVTLMLIGAALASFGKDSLVNILKN